MDRNGGSTTTLLSQHSETYPANQGESATPAVSELAADPRGNVVVKLMNNQSQLFGPDSSAPIQRIFGTTLVSYDGVRVERGTTDLLEARSYDDQLLWTDSTQGRPKAFHPERNTVFVQDGLTIREVGPGADEWVTPLPAGATKVTHLVEDEWLVESEDMVVDLIGPTAESPIEDGIQGSKRAQGSLLSPLCNDSITDPRTKILGQYVSYGVGWEPPCEAFTQSLPGPSHYAFGTKRQAGTWNVSNSFDWAILTSALVSNVSCVVTAYGSVPPLNSGYRTPYDQMRIKKVHKWKNAFHVQGLGADFKTLMANGHWNKGGTEFIFEGDDPGAPAWNTLKAIAKEGTCGTACVEPRFISPDHLHVDYRPTAACPVRDW